MGNRLKNKIAIVTAAGQGPERRCWSDCNRFKRDNTRKFK